MIISAAVDVTTTAKYDARTERRKIDHIRTPTISSAGPTSAHQVHAHHCKRQEGYNCIWKNKTKQMTL